ncbi:MAG: cytochrome c oxidase subunit 3 [Firmicutes bacterium]|nr:cytochrome c oxidase subunit 3 [Alicyclobacillaceae bacterium]MCL6497652.1 cytochrome c oxidase subunit 3 [Bacillota bacterium]
MAEMNPHLTTHPVETEMPAAPDNSVLGVWIWLSAESLFFASLIATFLLLHNQTNGGPGLGRLIDLQLTFIATVTLLSSSLTMALGYAQVLKGNLGGFRFWLVVTALLGLGFAGMQAFEFHHLYTQGFSLSSSPAGSAFFTLTGFHGLHVLFGAFWLISLLAFSFKKEFVEEAAVKVKVLGLYWHFVDVVWVIIFTVVYLMGKVA